MAKKWKYNKLVTSTDADWSKVEEMGKDGWELVEVRYDSGNVIYYFKK